MSSLPAKTSAAGRRPTDGYVVQLHTPVSGAYTLLATYERPFKAQGETLTFTGARPLDAQSEQGYTLIISAYQFQVKPETVSPGLLPLETGEVPPEYRLFFDAPILAAYRYTSRPFDLKLALSPLAQGDSLSQVVDRASDHDSHLEGRPGAHRRALLREEPRQPALPPDAAPGHAVVVGGRQRRLGRAGDGRAGQPHSLAPARGPERRADARPEAGGDQRPETHHRGCAHCERARDARRMEAGTRHRPAPGLSPRLADARGRHTGRLGLRGAGADVHGRAKAAAR